MKPLHECAPRVGAVIALALMPVMYVGIWLRAILRSAYGCAVNCWHDVKVCASAVRYGNNPPKNEPLELDS